MKFKTTYNLHTVKSVTKKFISNSLILGLLFNSTSSSFASILSEDRRYETFNDNHIIIEDILEEDNVDVEIKGNTLVNIINYNQINKSSSWEYNIDKRTGYISIGSPSDAWIPIHFGVNKEVELGKEYTLFVNITKNTLVRDNASIDKVVKISIGNHTYVDTEIIKMHIF